MDRPKVALVLRRRCRFFAGAGLDFPPFHAVVPQKRLVALLKISKLCEVVHRRCHLIRAMQQWNSAQLSQGRLQPFTEAGETF